MSVNHRIFAAALAAAALSLATATQATVLTFEDLPHEFELKGVGDSVFSKGYRLQYTPEPDEPYPVGFFSVGSVWQFNGRSTALVANSCSATTTLTAQDNNPITLLAIDLAELNGDTNASVTFEGLTVKGEVVRKAFKLRGSRTWQTVVFPPSFHRLQYVRWKQGDCTTNPPHMFDNVRVYQSWRGRDE